jgi:hypothetical protein
MFPNALTNLLLISVSGVSGWLMALFRFHSNLTESITRVKGTTCTIQMTQA